MDVRDCFTAEKMSITVIEVYLIKFQCYAEVIML